MKPKLGYKWREGEQIPTRLVTLEQIMSTREFEFGVVDARAGRGYRAAYGQWKPNDCWNFAVDNGLRWRRDRSCSSVTVRSPTKL